MICCVREVENTTQQQPAREPKGLGESLGEGAWGRRGRKAPFPSCLHFFIACFQRKQRDRPLAVLAALTAPFAGNWGGTSALKDHLA